MLNSFLKIAKLILMRDLEKLWFAESAVGVTAGICLDKLCGHRFVCLIAHRRSPSNLILIGPCRRRSRIEYSILRIRLP